MSPLTRSERLQFAIVGVPVVKNNPWPSTPNGEFNVPPGVM
jgi:hypothetical protein